MPAVPHRRCRTRVAARTRRSGSVVAQMRKSQNGQIAGKAEPLANRDRPARGEPLRIRTAPGEAPDPEPDQHRRTHEQPQVVRLRERDLIELDPGQHGS